MSAHEPVASSLLSTPEYPLGETLTMVELITEERNEQIGDLLSVLLPVLKVTV